MALGWIARHQKRWLGLVGFSGGMEGNVCWQSPKRWDENSLLTWLEHNYGGGTSPYVPFQRLPNEYWVEFHTLSKGAVKGKTDIILLSDGEIHLPSDVVEDFNKWKTSNKVRVMGLMLGHHLRGGGMQKVLDECHGVSHILSTTDQGVQQALSV